MPNITIDKQLEILKNGGPAALAQVKQDNNNQTSCSSASVNNNSMQTFSNNSYLTENVQESSEK